MPEKVRDRWEIDEDLLTLKADESEYWRKSSDFYESVLNIPADYMSPSQQEWLTKIEQDLGSEDDPTS